MVLGATGNVGGTVAETLLARGEQVLVVTRDPGRARPWLGRGAQVAVANAGDPDALRRAFRRGRRAFLLNPLGEIDGDLDEQQRRTADGIVRALDGSGLEKVVLASTYGAQRGDRIGDLGTLWELEEALRAQPIPAAVNRAAYYLTNWAMVQEPARSGVLPTMLPMHHRIPMVAPRDVGIAAADRMQSDVDDVALRWVEGPAEYTSLDVAQAFADAFGHAVRVEVTPRDRWLQTFLDQGFSAASAESFAGMTAVTLDQREPVVDPIRGSTTLESFVRGLVG